MSIPLLHPETAEGDPRLLKWSIGNRTLPAVPPQLLALVEEGVLARVETAPGQVLTWLGANRSWSTEGPRVRSLLFAALSAPHQEALTSSAALLSQIQALLQQEVAPVADAHGGMVTARSVQDGVLTVDFGGACQGCAASGNTLSHLVSRTVRTRYPQITEVRAGTSQRKWIPLSLRRPTTI